MNISSKLKIAALAPAIMTLAVGVAVVYSSRTMEVALAKDKVAQHIIDSANSFPTLARGYLLYNEERPKMQFLQEQAALDKLLASAGLHDKEQEQLLSRIRVNNQAMKRSFVRLVLIQTKPGVHDEAALHQEAEERLAGHLVVKSHDVLSDALRLQNLIDNDMAATQRRVSVFRFLFTLLTALTLTILLTRLQRSIAASLTALRNGTETVAGGNLTYRIALRERDEIGDVSRAFDLMTERLEETTVSREALRESEERYRTLFTHLSEGFALCEIILDDKGEPCDFRYLEANEAFEKQTGLTLSNAIGKTVREIIPDIEPYWIDTYGKVALTGEPALFENRVHELNKDFEVIAFCPMKGRFAAVFLDITERKQAEMERETTIELLRIVNESTATGELVSAAVTFFQRQSDCEAVGIRLRDGFDYPYYETRGFPGEFITAENSLCLKDADGNTELDDVGNPVIACMCGNVIQGRFDPSKPFFTEHGSFWTNSTTALLASTTEADRQARTRNRCNGEGYESVALLPLHVGDQQLGLLQLNDKRKDRFTLETIALWERLADYLAIALAQLRAEEDLREANVELDARAEELASMNEELAVSNEEIAATNDDLHREMEQRTRAEKALRENEAHMLQFYRKTILAATQGKLFVTDPDGMAEVMGQPLAHWTLNTTEDMATIRHLAVELAETEGIHGERLLGFLSCVGEATSNAYNHAGGGEASMYRKDGHLLFAVSDHGPGIQGINLPNVALEEGYTTAGTLGMGYKLMMASCDRVYLATSPEGTTVAVEMGI